MTLHFDFDAIAAADQRGRLWRSNWNYCALAHGLGVGRKADCPAKGLPIWAAELVIWAFDCNPSPDYVTRTVRLMRALDGLHPNQIEAGWAPLRHRAILPVAMEALVARHVDADWYRKCIAVVQSAMDDPEAKGNPAEAAGAAEAVWAVEAAGGAGAAGAAGAARDAGAVGADRIIETAIAVFKEMPRMEGEKL